MKHEWVRAGGTSMKVCFNCREIKNSKTPKKCKPDKDETQINPINCNSAKTIKL